MTLTIYFVRHGQSEDNVRNIWAGWKDAPLSAKGQAEAVGRAFADKHISAIFASDLKRASATGRAIHEHQPDDRKPPFTELHGLREQFFGDAEGHPWIVLSPGDPDYDPSAKVYHVPTGRDDLFPGGESLNLLRQRAIKQVLEPHLLPLIWAARGKDEADGGAVVCASHGLCISELCSAIVDRDPDIPKGKYAFAGLHNTAWHAIRVGVKGESSGTVPPQGEEIDLATALTVEVIKMNDHSHLRAAADSVNIQQQEESKLRDYLSGKAA
ncbi:phosphoglycerate mutase-like protein [Auriculariales sp. MPI-PUGE-AT-0066]|nr:phosphoglycerate mutase-like protein [Auriculariales sp. MPI-PUGE-AT-0066]